MARPNYPAALTTAAIIGACSPAWTARFNRRMIGSGPWSAAMDVGGWLRGLGLGQYEALFRASEIDTEILPELTEVDLEKLGVPLGHRKRLLRAISGLAAPGSPLSHPPPQAGEGR